MDFELIEKIARLVLSLLTLLIAFVAYRKAARNNKKAASNLEDEISAAKENKISQIKKEEEIKDMAKTLCDRCGSEINVRDAVLFDELDVCQNCADELQAIKDNSDLAKKEYEIALANFEAAKKELDAARLKFALTETKTEEPKNASENVLSKLFNKKGEL